MEQTNSAMYADLNARKPSGVIDNLVLGYLVVSLRMALNTTLAISAFCSIM